MLIAKPLDGLPLPGKAATVSAGRLARADG